jgi:hypothetical protein
VRRSAIAIKHSKIHFHVHPKSSSEKYVFKYASNLYGSGELYLFKDKSCRSLHGKVRPINFGAKTKAILFRRPQNLGRAFETTLVEKHLGLEVP